MKFLGSHSVLRLAPLESARRRTGRGQHEGYLSLLVHLREETAVGKSAPLLTVNNGLALPSAPPPLTLESEKKRPRGGPKPERHALAHDVRCAGCLDVEPKRLGGARVRKKVRLERPCTSFLFRVWLEPRKRII